jgi:hypothetical protein
VFAVAVLVSHCHGSSQDLYYIKPNFFSSINRIESTDQVLDHVMVFCKTLTITITVTYRCILVGTATTYNFDDGCCVYLSAAILLYTEISNAVHVSDNVVIRSALGVYANAMSRFLSAQPIEPPYPP